MDYLITFLEGIIAFISPCMLPLLPIYISYFAGGTENGKKTIRNALGFVLGFTDSICIVRGICWYTWKPTYKIF